MSVSIPIITLKIDGMRHHMQLALHEHMMQIDSDVQNAIKEFCTPEHIQDLVSECAEREIEAALKEEIASFFKYGDGRKLIKEIVESQVKKPLPPF